MNISIKGYSTNIYQLVIRYHYKGMSGYNTKSFHTMDEFSEFMDECHPDVDYNEVGVKYSKRLELLNKLGGQGTIDSRYTISNVNCFISGGSMVVCYDDVGIMEKLYEHNTMKDKVNNGYLHTFLAHNWSFDGQAGGYFKISYWYDKESNNDAYKVHCFKNKVVFEQSNGLVHSMIVCDKYYIHFEGARKKSS